MLAVLCSETRIQHDRASALIVDDHELFQKQWWIDRPGSSTGCCAWRVACMPVNPWVEPKIKPPFKPEADDEIGPEGDHGAMTITDYLINAIFVLVVLRQARERELDRPQLSRPPRTTPWPR